MTTPAQEFKFKFLECMGKKPDVYDGGPILVHGVYASGKTHLVGDAIQVEQAHGPVVFANIIGEDGEESAKVIKSLPEKCRVDIKSHDAAEELAAYCEHIKARLLCVDSLPLLYDLVIAKKTGGTRPPLMTKENNEWTQIHQWMESLMTKLRRCAHIVLFTSPSDLGLDLVKEQESTIKSRSMIVPDMRGKYATACVKWFNLVGYLKADLKQGNMVREFHLAKSDKWLTRQRLPNEITVPIPVPSQGGGWTNIMEAVRKSYDNKG